MYIAELDRPWLETPFLFQGFFVRSEDEIADLKVHCEHVYIDSDSVQQEAATALRNTTTLPARANGGQDEAAGKKRGFSLRSLFQRKDADDQESVQELTQTGVFHEESVGLKTEIDTASGIHSQAVTTVSGVMADLRRGGTLDVQRLKSSVAPMVDSVLRNPAALACLIRMQEKDDYLYHHSLASSVWATILGRQIGLCRDDLNVIALGALLLDVGKTKIPDEILHKPSGLDNDELQLIQRHVEFGMRILQQTGDVDERVLEMVKHHHERFNGTGYPQGLEGNAIPVFGRIAGIVDAYDAMITQRPYARPVSSYDALRQLQLLADVEFQAEIVDQLTRAIGVFPTGTLVELNTGEIAIVTKQNRIRRLRPEVMLIMDSNKKMLEQFRVADLNDETVSADAHQSLWIDCGLPPGSFGIDPTEFYLN